MYSRAVADERVHARLREPSAIRYIKLGQGGGWAPQAIEQSIIPFGFSQVPHAPCAAGDWDAVRRALQAAGRTKSGVSQGVRELQNFYQLGPDALWVTFADRHLYWTVAEREVIAVGAPEPGVGIAFAGASVVGAG